jgi:hypothetical protein
VRIEATRKNFEPIVYDYVVGGYPLASRVEMGSYSYYIGDNKSHNVSGRVFEAFNNKTFSGDYELTVYSGYGEFNRSTYPYEQLNYYGNDEYYTGMYEIYDLTAGPYVAIVDAPGFIKNF